MQAIPVSDPVTFGVTEQTTGRVTAAFVDEDGVTPLPASSIATLLLTLYVIKEDGTQQIVNSRSGQNVLNANNVTVDNAGNFVWTYQTADTTLVETIAVERHIALFSWVGTSGQTGKKEIVLAVRHLARTA